MAITVDWGWEAWSLSGDLLSALLSPTKASLELLVWGWRCRAKLAVRGSSTDPLIGLYQEGTHNVVDIPDCKAHHPNINAAVELLKQGIAELNVEPYDEDQGTGELRYVQMAVTTYNTSLPYAERYRNGKVQVALVWNSRDENSPSSKKLNALANFLWRYGGPNRKVHLIHSIWANFQTSINNVPFLFGVPVFEKAAVLVIHLIFRRTGRHLFLTDNDGGKPPLLKRMLEDYSEFYFMYIA